MSTYKEFLDGKLLHGRYELVEGLNEGSFGIVSLAKDIQNGCLVALKYNTGKASDFAAFEAKEDRVECVDGMDHCDLDEEIVRRETLKEVQMLQKVGKHPNIVQMLDNFGTCIVLEYVSRGDLHDAIQMGIAPVSTRDVVDVFMQLISAVEHCHSFQVYHRDIKPENILISEDWAIKLTDFGLATEHLVCHNFDVGSERYMAPELLEHDGVESYMADKVDIWSLGICLINLVFGKSPFKSASSKDKMFMYFASNRETLFDIFPTMSYDLFSVLRHSLTIDPENRDLAAFKESLSKLEVLTYDYEFEEVKDESTRPEPTEISIGIPTPEATLVGKSAPEKSLLTQKLQEYTAKPILEVNDEPVQDNDRQTKEKAEPFYMPPTKRFPHGRRPLNIPTMTRHRNRSQGGRVFKSPDKDDSVTYFPEEFFTPRSVFDHYMEKASKHRQFDRSTHERTRDSGEYKGRAWQQRRNARTPNGYRLNNRAPRRFGRYTPAPAAKTQEIPILSHSAKVRRSQNFSSPTGKYVPPNMRARAMSPVQTREPELAPPEENQDDDLFMFEEPSKSGGSRSGGCSRPRRTGYTLLHSPESQKVDAGMSGLSQQFAEVQVGSKTKYVPPHHRRNSHSAAQRQPFGARLPRSKQRVISSSVPTENTNWFMNIPEKANWADYDDDDDDDCDCVSGYGLTYVK